MLAALGGLETASALAILVKAGAYAASLAAAGAVLVLALMPEIAGEPRRAARRLALLAAGLGAALTLLLAPLAAAFLGGGTLAAAVDPMLLGLVLDGPQGSATWLRVVGLAAVAAAALGVAERALSWAGASFVAASFALVGHATGEPRLALALAVTVHTLAVAFWIGAFHPLHAVLGTDPAPRAAATCERFGRLAGYAVAAVLIAGIALLLMLGGRASVLATAWGQFLALKVAAVAGLLWLALRNRDTLTPALRRGEEGAAARLRQAIRREGWVVAAILLATATLTTVAAP